MAWAASTGTFLAAGQAVGIELTVAQAALLTSGVALVTIIPSGPGYLGTFELTVVGIADGFGIPRDDAFALGPPRPPDDPGDHHDRRCHRAARRRRRDRAPQRAAVGPASEPTRTLTRGRFPHVFEPLRLRHRTLPSRITFGAHTANMAEGGLPGERHIGYYRERALGGAGMIVVEPIPVHRTAVLTRGNFRHDDDAVIPAFRRLTDACREANPDVVMIHQLYHVGQHGDADNSFAPNWSPSGSAVVPRRRRQPRRDGGRDRGADRGVRRGGAARAGQRLRRHRGLRRLPRRSSTSSGRRGRTAEPTTGAASFENRMRFSAEILRRIRERCGEDFIIGLAVSADPGVGGLAVGRGAREVVAWHDERRLMDYVTCGTGSYFDFEAIIPTSLYEQRLGEPFAAALKKVVRHALVQAESHIRTPAAAEAVLAAGHADMVSIVRGQIADPHLVAKARAGRADEVRPCISCNQLCWGRRSRDYWISCLVNPSAGREWEWGGDRFEREPARGACWSSAAARPASRRRASRRNADTA